MDAKASSRERIARYRAAQRKRGLRPVTLWLPDERDPAYRARMAEECRRLSNSSPEEAELIEDFAVLISEVEGWE